MAWNVRGVSFLLWEKREREKWKEGGGGGGGGNEEGRRNGLVSILTDDERHDCNGPDSELPRRTKKSVNNQGDARRVEPIDGREFGDEGIAHALGHEECANCWCGEAPL